MTSRNLHYLQITITLGVRISTSEFGEDTIQSVIMSIEKVMEGDPQLALVT